MHALPTHSRSLFLRVHFSPLSYWGLRLCGLTGRSSSVNLIYLSLRLSSSCVPYFLNMTEFKSFSRWSTLLFSLAGRRREGEKRADASGRASSSCSGLDRLTLLIVTDVSALWQQHTGHTAGCDSECDRFGQPIANKPL